jgi:hypothetical protein
LLRSTGLQVTATGKYTLSGREPPSFRNSPEFPWGTAVPLYSLPVPGVRTVLYTEDKNKTEKLQYPCGIILRFYGLTTYVKISANLCLSSFDLLSIIAEYLDVCKLFHSFTEQDGLWERSCAAYKFKSLFAITKTRGNRFLKSPACVLSVVVLFGVW